MKEQIYKIDLWWGVAKADNDQTCERQQSFDYGPFTRLVAAGNVTEAYTKFLWEFVDFCTERSKNELTLTIPSVTKLNIELQHIPLIP